MPTAGPGAVVVEVVAATVNPTDTLLRAGAQAAAMADLAPPFIPGMEFAGHVYQVGFARASLAVGQPVMGIVSPRRPGGGAQARHVCVPAASLAPLADGVDLVAAATVPMNGLTAKMAVEALELDSGNTVLVTGGAGAVGGYAIQLAKLAGLVVIADANDSDTALLMQLGADEVVPRGDAMFPAIQQRHPDGVAGVIDAARIGGQVAPLVRSAGIVVGVRKDPSAHDQRLRYRHVSVLEQATNTAALAWLADLVREGKLTPRVAERLTMSRAAHAHRLVEQGGLRGRVVLLFGGCRS